MNKRALILIVSVIVALLLLAGILLVDRPTADPAEGAAGQDAGGIVAADDLPGFNPDGSQPTRDINAGEVERYEFEQINSHGQLVQFFGDRLIPKPAGVIDVEMPVCRVHLVADQRIMQVRADSGTFLAPDDEPKSGELVGNVVVQLFDSNGTGPVSTKAGSPHLELQVTLPRARFDLDLGQLTSDQTVIVSGPRLAFEGTGLQLSYNALRNRIDRLVIEKGKRMWFRHQRDNQVAMADGKPQAGNAEKNTDQTSTPGEVDERPLVYKATFEKNVRVTSPEAVIDADQLDVLFSMTSSDEEEVSLSKATTVRPQPNMIAMATYLAGISRDLSFAGVLHQQAVGLVRYVTGTSFAQIKAQNVDMQPSADAVVITWEGRMVVVPQLDPPADLAANDELMVTLTGSPLRVVTGDNDVITGGKLTYAGNLDVMTIEAVDDQTPLTITSPQLGTLTGRQFVLNQADARGKLLGPGKLIASQADSEGGSSRGLSDMTLSFAKQVDLDLVTGDANQDEGDATSRMNLAGIRSARFIGDVAVGHPRFDMTSDTLDVELDNATSPATVKQIVAHGHAKAVAHKTENEPESTIAGQSITLDLKPTASGNVEPVKLTAAGGVVARQAERVLLTGHLEADLAASASTGSDEPQLLVKQVRATQGVEAKLDDQDVDIFATRLEADPSNNMINLFGTDETLARIERPDGVLSGKHLILMADTEAITVPGPGVAEFFPEPDEAEAADQNAGEGLRIKWSKRMMFNNSENFAEFSGNINAQAKDETERTTLTSGELRLDFVPEREAIALQKADPDDRRKIARSIRTITAKTDVAFTSESFEDKLDGNLQTRLSVKGPLVTFDGQSEQVQVLGEGTMLVEDYRPEKPREGGQSDGELAKFSGRGTTVFSWVKSLMLDALNNDMKISGDVRMAHRPAGENQLSKLFADRFIADLQETGGLGVWMSSEAPKPRLNGAFADGNVVVQMNGRTIQTDHLDYKAAEQLLTLRANPGGVTTISKDNDPQSPPITAEQIDYQLETGRIEIGGMGTIKAPAR